VASPGGRPVKGEHLAVAQGIPPRFLENILADLRHAGLLSARRGADGGYALTRAPSDISVAEVLRAVEGPLAAVQGARPEGLHYQGAAARLPEVWVALRANLRAVLERVTLADLAAGTLPASVAVLTTTADAWEPH
jgi:Rrf2 family protein